MPPAQTRIFSTLSLGVLVSATLTHDAFAQPTGTSPPQAAPAPPPPAPPPPAPPPPAPPPPPPPPGDGGPVPRYVLAPEASPTAAPPVEAPRRFGVFVDPLNLLFGTFGAELSVSPALPVALNLGFQYRKDDVANDPLSNAKIELTQVGVRAGVQVFPMTERWMRGFYVYPRATYVKGSTNETQFYNKADTSGVELAVMAGYQWRWNNGFAIRLGGGGGYRKVEVELASKSTLVAPQKVGIEGGAVVAEFALGWTF